MKMIAASRVNIHRYETPERVSLFSDTPLVPIHVAYGAPAELKDMERASEVTARIARAHVAHYNGEAHLAAKSFTKEEIIAKRGTIPPSCVAEEYIPLARVLFAMVVGMKRSGSVWLDIYDHAADFIMGADDAWDEALECGAILKRPSDGKLALAHFAALDDAFTQTFKSQKLAFMEGNLAPHIAAKKYVPKDDGLTFSKKRCVDAYVDRGEICVGMTSLFWEATRPPPPPAAKDPGEDEEEDSDDEDDEDALPREGELPEDEPTDIPKPKAMDQEEMQKAVFVAGEDGTALFVSMEGVFQISPPDKCIQCRIFRPWGIYSAGQLVWVAAHPEKCLTAIQVWTQNREMSEIISLSDLYTFASPARACTYDAFARNTYEYDTIVLMHPMPHPRFYYEACARSERVLILTRKVVPKASKAAKGEKAAKSTSSSS